MTNIALQATGSVKIVFSVVVLALALLLPAASVHAGSLADQPELATRYIRARGMGCGQLYCQSVIHPVSACSHLPNNPDYPEITYIGGSLTTVHVTGTHIESALFIVSEKH